MAETKAQRKARLRKEADDRAAESKKVVQYNQKTSEDAELLKEQRIQDMVALYEQKTKEAENEKENLEIERLTLDEAYKNKLADLKREYDEKETALISDRGKLKDQKELLIQEIKSDELRIREEYRNELENQFESELKQKRKDFGALLKKDRAEIERNQKQIEKEKARIHEAKLQIEIERTKMLAEMQQKIEIEFEEVRTEYEEKYSALLKKEKDIKENLIDIEIEKEDIESDRQSLSKLKSSYQEKMEHFSEAKVAELESQIKTLESYRIADRKTIDGLLSEINRWQSLAVTDDGDVVRNKLEELLRLSDELDRLRDERANLPSNEEIKELRLIRDELENLKLLLDKETEKRIQAEARANASMISARELENARITANALDTLNKQLQDRVNWFNKQTENIRDSKFSGLLEIDSQLSKTFNYRNSHTGLSLDHLVEYVRSYGAAKEGLFYSKETIRAFIASLSASRLIILQGLSGTGKSSLPRLFQEALGFNSHLISVQSSWRDNRELLGYDNDFTNRFKETEFTKKLYEAGAMPNQDKVYFIVLDEMNLARVEYYFADFLTVLEKSNVNEWTVPLIESYTEIDETKKPKYFVDGARIQITKNIWFVGTANRDDSTSLITDKVYDRAQVLDLNGREKDFSAEVKKIYRMSFDELDRLFVMAKADDSKKMTDDDWDKIEKIDVILKEQLDITFGNRIKKQIENFVPVYIACGGTKAEAIDYLLTHKILRKLDERYEAYLIDGLELLKQEIEYCYQGEHLIESLKKIDRIKNKLGG